MWCLIGFALLLTLFKRKSPDGVPTAMYLVFYGLGRAWIEGLRTDSLYLWGMRVSQVLSVIMVITGLVILAVIMYKDKKRGITNGQKINSKTV